MNHIVLKLPTLLGGTMYRIGREVVGMGDNPPMYQALEQTYHGPEGLAEALRLARAANAEWRRDDKTLPLPLGELGGAA